MPSGSRTACWTVATPAPPCGCWRACWRPNRSSQTSAANVTGSPAPLVTTTEPYVLWARAALGVLRVMKADATVEEELMWSLDPGALLVVGAPPLGGGILPGELVPRAID